MWTFDDALTDSLTIYDDHFGPRNLTFQFFVCPRLIDEWEMGNVNFVRGQLRNEAATLLGWDAIGHLIERGNVIGSHGVDHASFSTMTPDQAAEQLGRSKEMIHARTGIVPATFAFPFGYVQPSSVDASVFARTWYSEVHLSDNLLPIGELADGVFNRRHGEFGTCVLRGLVVGALNIVFGVTKSREK